MPNSARSVYHGEQAMPRKRAAIDKVVFHIDFKKGKAERNRLPLAHVLATLQQMDLMIREVGMKVQRANGVENPDGDFGIELLAGATGIAFSKGSIKTAAAATKDIVNATRTLHLVIGTTSTIEKKQVSSVDEYGTPIVRRLTTISEIQQKDQTEMQLRLAEAGTITGRAKLSERGFESLRALSATDLTIEAVTVYGKLKRVSDHGKDEDETLLWGDLVDDTGESWRVNFKGIELKKVQRLFTRRVVIFGAANYFRTKAPRLDAKTVDEDKDRHYITGLNKFRKNYRNVFGDRDPQEILRDIRG
jgi:hypothetical protein